MDGVQKHSDDCQSVDAWVKELQNSDYDPVFLYKVQEFDCISVVNSDAFDKEHFVLCIQRKFQ